MALTGVLRCRSTSLRHKYISEPLRDDVHVLVLLSGQLLARVQPRQYLLLPNPAKMVSSSGVVARDCCDTSGSPFLDSAEKSALLRPLCFFTEPANGDEPTYDTKDESLPGTRNYPHHRVTVPIHDVHDSKESFSLAKNSFAVLPGAFDKPHIIDLNDEGHGCDDYVQWVKDLLLSAIEGSKKVFVWNHTIRKASQTKVVNRQVNKLHVDQSIDGAFRRARRHLSAAEIDLVDAGHSRFRIINVWKPLSGPVLDHPIVFADHRSIEQDDLVPVKQVYPDYVGETYVLRHRDGQQFWYWSKMGPGDVVLLQCFDSKPLANSGAGMRHAQCVHGSFELNDGGEERFERTSIEVRCIVLG